MDGRIHLTADGECRSQGAEHRAPSTKKTGSGPEAEGCGRASVQPSGVRGSRDPSQEKVNATPHVWTPLPPHFPSLLSAGVAPTLRASLQTSV